MKVSSPKPWKKRQDGLGDDGARRVVARGGRQLRSSEYNKRKARSRARSGGQANREWSNVVNRVVQSKKRRGDEGGRVCVCAKGRGRDKSWAAQNRMGIWGGRSQDSMCSKWQQDGERATRRTQNTSRRLGGRGEASQPWDGIEGPDIDGNFGLRAVKH